MKKNIVFITGNEGKRKEVEALLGSKKYNIVNKLTIYSLLNQQFKYKFVKLLTLLN